MSKVYLVKESKYFELVTPNKIIVKVPYTFTVLGGHIVSMKSIPFKLESVNDQNEATCEFYWILSPELLERGVCLHGVEMKEGHLWVYFSSLKEDEKILEGTPVLVGIPFEPCMIQQVKINKDITIL